ncbi:MAG: ribosomal protein L7/L12 [Nocardioides sp.]|nr:ribosomal protein L7/L12 [Nocardioides sp.]
MGLFDAASRSEVDRLKARVRRLEGVAEALARLAGLSEQHLDELRGDQVSPAVRQLVLGGRKIQAIKVHREETGLGLKEAKDEVEAL